MTVFAVHDTGGLMRAGSISQGFAAVVLMLAILAAPICATAGDGGVFILDKEHTSVRFSYEHLGMSWQSGSFRDVIGRLAFDPERPEMSELNVTIKVATVTTGVPAYDRVLSATNDYLDAAAYPDITFTSTAVSVTSAKTANVTGDLTINGVSRPVTLAVVWNFLGEHPLAKVNPLYQGVNAAGFSARTQILRSEWGISRGIPLLSDEIRISIEAELHRLN